MESPPEKAPPLPALSVSELNRRVKRLLEGQFDFIWVEGEISNFAAPSSGHWYFSLKDSSAQVRCAMFRGRNQRIRLRPANGDAVRIRCRVSLYEGRGEFQLIAEYLEPAGSGALQVAFEELKRRLLQEGLFAPDRKKPLPGSVRRLGVITSPTGAAIHDILTVLGRRAPGIEVVLLPVAVQGDSAAGEIAAALTTANRLGTDYFDALIVGRGGGSLEDLWAFNEEIVARAIAASELPVVSAVGHEIDFSIADMAADARAATPSAAAELLSTDQTAQLQQLSTLDRRLRLTVRHRLDAAGAQLRTLQAQLRHPGSRLAEQAQRVDDLEQRLHFAWNTTAGARRAQLDLLIVHLQGQSPAAKIVQYRHQCTALGDRLWHAMHTQLKRREDALRHVTQLLDSVSPLKVLERGYAIITDGDGKVLSDATNASVGQQLTAKLAQGSLAVEVVAEEA